MHAALMSRASRNTLQLEGLQGAGLFDMVLPALEE
jgi:hypothetical protein